MDAVSEYRKRRQERADGKRLAREWEEWSAWNESMLESVESQEYLLESIIQEAEMIKLFSGKDDEDGKKITDRCIESLQKYVLTLTAKNRKEHDDSAFFEGELNDNIGERNVLYPELDAFKERRQKRLDDEDDEGRWITTENNHKVHLNEEGKPDKGNPNVVSVMKDHGGARAAARIGFKKSALGNGEIGEYNSKFVEFAKRMTDANRRVKEEEKKINEKWKGVPYSKRPYSAWNDYHKEQEEQKKVESELLETLSSMPDGTLLSNDGMLYEKSGGGWLIKGPREDGNGGKPLSEKEFARQIAGRDYLKSVSPVKAIETTDEAEMVRPIELKDDETYKSFAETINTTDKKGVVSRAKKDPEFKELVDGITLYTQGAYGDQKKEAQFLVEHGLDEASITTAGDYFGDGYYDMKQLWNGQKLAESNSSFSGGVLSMIGAINNAEPYEKGLWRIADDRNILKESDKMGALYIPPKVGDRIKMDAPTSFTKDKDVLKDIGNTKYGDIITYELEPGARALDIEQLSHYKSQREAITCGEFEVVDVSVKNSGGMRRVKKDAKPEVVESAKKRMIGVDEDGNYIVPFYKVSVKIRQVGKTEVGKRDDSITNYYVCDHFDGRIGFGDKITAYRERRQKRLDAKKDEIEWITVNGAHIPIDENGDLKGKVGDEIERHAKEAEGSEPKKEPVTKNRVNKKLNEIADSDMSDEEKVKAIKSEFPGLRPGTKIIMPESWNDDDGKPQTYTYDGMFWNDDKGWGSVSEEDMAYYFIDKDPNERPKIKSIPRDPDSVEASRKKKEASKNYAMNPDGSINGKYTKDFHNEHVSQEERDAFSKEIKEMVDYEKGWDSSRSLYRNEANRVGAKIADEIKRRAALRRGDKENCPINDRPQVEDIYDVLKDMRDFGAPEGFDPKVNSDLPKERTDAIIKEAFDRFPTDWFKDADSEPVINIIDGPGRAICMNKGYINVYTQKDPGFSSGPVTLNDRALVNDLAHELGHYFEWSNQKVQYSARDCLWERGKDSEIIEVEPGYNGYKDSFFNPYMGKIYSHGGTEIISMVMGNIGCFDPFPILEGCEFDYSKGKYDGRKKRDKESLGYVLGVLAGL